MDMVRKFRNEEDNKILNLHFPLYAALTPSNSDNSDWTVFLRDDDGCCEVPIFTSSCKTKSIFLGQCLGRLLRDEDGQEKAVEFLKHYSEVEEVVS